VRELNRQGFKVARCTIERLMRELGLEGARRGKKIRTTVPDPRHERAADLLKRDFTATRPNQQWVARLHLRSHLGRDRLRRILRGHLLPRHRGLVGIDQQAGQAGARRPGHGAMAP
jgi:hypothetical protein